MGKAGRSTYLVTVSSVVFILSDFGSSIAEVLKKYLWDLESSFLHKCRPSGYRPLNPTKAVAFLLTFGCFTLGALPVSGQSDPSNFTTIINSPDAIIGDDEPIGSNTQVNIFDGANIGRDLGGRDFDSTNIEINVFGGVVPNIDFVSSGGAVNVSGGLVGTAEGARSTINGRPSGPGIRSSDGSTVNISGGTIQGDSRFFDGVVTITGGEFLGPVTASSSNFSVSGGIFSDIVRAGNISTDSESLTLTAGDLRLNGEAFSGNTLPSFLFRDVLSGTFADGSGFIFSGRDGDRLLEGASIQAISLSAPDLQPIAISQATDTAPQNLRAGQTLNLSNNGALGVGFTAVGSTVSVDGGNVGDSFEASEATVNVTGGNIGERFNAFSGSDVNITGGSFGRDFLAGENSNVRISGGSFGDRFTTSNGSTTLVGGEFLLNGAPLTDPSSVTFDLLEENVFTATLADGTVSIFALKPEVVPSFPTSLFPDSPFPSLQFSSDRLNNVTLETSALPAADLSPIVIDGNSSSQLRGLRAGQTLTVLDGGSVDRNFAAVGSTVDLQGGSVGDNFEVARARVTVSGGTVGDRFNVFQDSRVTISGGEIGDYFYAGNNSRVAVLGGEIGDDVNIVGGSTIEIDGGVIGQDFAAAADTTVDLRSGSIGNSAFVGGALNLSGGQIGDALNASGPVNISGGSIGSDAAFSGSNVNVSGGSVGDGLRLFNDIHVVVSGDGVLGNDVLFENGVTIDINGGSVGDGLTARGNSYLEASVVNLFEGSIGDDADFFGNGVLNVFGGSVGERLVVTSFSTLNVFGGSVLDSIDDGSNGTINLFVTEAVVDGVALDLFEDVPFELADLGAPVDGILSDGSVFSFDGSNLFNGPTVNLFRASSVPEPSAYVLGVALLLASACRRRKTICG